MIAGIIIVTLLGIFVVWILIPSKQEKLESAEQKKRLEDDLIYDPDTGARMTLEQAEAGHFIHHDFTERIKTDEEIEHNYVGDEKEVQYILRDLIKIKQLAPEDQDDLLDALNKSTIVRRFDSVDLWAVWEYKPDLYVGLMYISNQYQAGRMLETIFENQLIIILKGLRHGHLQHALNESEVDHVEEYKFLRHPRKVTHHDFKSIMQKIES